MKRFYIIYIGIAIYLFSACSPGPNLESGDLLFQAGAASEMESAIADATGGKRSYTYTHVGIFLREKGEERVIEASTRGVRIVPFADFIAGSPTIGEKKAVVAMRLRDTTGVAAMVCRAKKFVGLPYDWHYRHANGALYCSELVWESYRDSLGRHLFEAQPMNFRATDGSMPRYWLELFERLGEQVPQGEAGTNPDDLSRSELLEEVQRWF